MLLNLLSLSLSLYQLSSPPLPPPSPSQLLSPVVKPVRVVPEPLPGLLLRRRVPPRLEPHEREVVAADDAGAVFRARVVAAVVSEGDGDVLGRPGAVGPDVVVDLFLFFLMGGVGGRGRGNGA